MRIRLLTSIAGRGFAHQVGDEANFPDADAIRLIRAGQAEPVRHETLERAVKRPKDKATLI